MPSREIDRATRDPSGEVVRHLEEVRPRLQSVLLRHRIPAQDAEDLLQQTFLTFVQQRSEIHSPQGWLLGTLRKNCLLYWRDRRRRLYEAVDATLLEWKAKPVEASQEQHLLREDVARAITRVHPRCQSLLVLRYSLGLEPRELALELSYSPSSISKITLRCLAAVTRQLILADGSCARRPATS